MKTLDKQQDKIREICDVLRKQTLEPAQDEAKRIIEEAQSKAELIVREAEEHVEGLLAEARKTIERERNVFHSSLSQASKQSIEALKQSIENELFNPELHKIVNQQTSEPNAVAQIISGIVKAIDKEGIGADLTAYIPSTVSPQQVNALLTKEILNKLKDKSVTLGNFSGGGKVRIEGKNITLELSNEEIEDLLKRYVRKDFRSLLFAN